MILSFLRISTISCLLLTTIITSLSAQITINESEHFIIGSDTIRTEDTNDTMFYYSHNKRALRVGVFNDGKAAEVRLGIGSAAFGLDNQAGGTFSTAFGTNNLVQGTSSFVWGRLNKNYGSQGTVWGLDNEARNNYTTVFGSSNDARQNNATAWGNNNVVDAQLATAWGEQNTVTGKRATVFGHSNTSTSPSSLTIGEYSKPFDPIDPLVIDSLDFLFVIGNGSADSLSNALTVNRIGYVGIGVDIPDQALHVNGNIYAEGTISQLSDVNSKYDFSKVNSEDILEAISSLPITTWKYKGSEETHLGPMAQDFYAAFELGGSNTTIATVDADGVALAAIKGLLERNIKLENLNTRLLERVGKNEKLLNQLLKEININE